MRDGGVSPVDSHRESPNFARTSLTSRVRLASMACRAHQRRVRRRPARPRSWEYPLGPWRARWSYPKTAPVGLPPSPPKRQDVPASQLLPQGPRAISSVPLKVKGTASWPPSPAPYRDNGFHRAESLSHIMGIRPGELGCQGDPLGIGNHMVLAACLAPVRGTRTRLLPPKGPAPRRCPAPPGASRSSHCHTPSPWEGLPRECPS